MASCAGLTNMYCWRAALRAVNRRATRRFRNFSSNPVNRNNGPIAYFPQTSSAELDGILDTLRTKFFLVEHLPRDQQKLVRSTKRAGELTSDEPVTAEVATTRPGAAKESFTLEPLRANPNPALREILVKLARLLEDDNDWSILPELIREVNITRFRIRDQVLRILITRAAQQERLGSLFNVLRQATVGARRPFAQSPCNVATWRIFLRAHEHEWTEASLDKAVRHMRNVLEIYEKSRIESSRVSSPMQPHTPGSLLALLAFRTRLFPDLDIPHIQMEELARKVLKTWPHANLPALESGSDVNSILGTWTWVGPGMQIASEILGTDSATGVELGQLCHKEIAPWISGATEFVKGQTDAVKTKIGIAGLDMMRELQTRLDAAKAST